MEHNNDKIVNWFSQPPGEAFSSFYHYDASTRVLIRIRLELQRSDRDNTCIVNTTNRYVGFYDPAKLGGIPGDIKNVANFTVKNNQVFWKATALETDPKPGLCVCDLSFDSNGAHDVHPGNKVAVDHHLPEGVTVDDLSQLVKIALQNIGKDGELTTYDASPKLLVQAIKEMIATDKYLPAPLAPAASATLVAPATNTNKNRCSPCCTIV